MATPPDARIIIFDTKGVDYGEFRNHPLLLGPIVSAPEETLPSLRWLVDEIESRFRAFAQINSRDIDGYNAKAGNYADKNQMMRRIIVFFDELTALSFDRSDEPLMLMSRICQKARASGIHVIATIRKASADNIPSDLKAQFTSRLSFKQSSHWDSRSIIDRKGAETLSLYGEALSTTPENSDLTYTHIPHIKD